MRWILQTPQVVVSGGTGVCEIAHSTDQPVWTAVQVITHELPLEKAAEGYKMFNDKHDGCMKVVLKPWDHEL